jgi:hypothetical protein
MIWKSFLDGRGLHLDLDYANLNPNLMGRKMASVSELVEDVAEILGERREFVNAYARALIDDGLLPKSSGRTIAQVSNLDILRLFCAVMLQPKIKETGSEVSAYLGMMRAGVNESFPVSMQQTAGDFLLMIVASVLEGPDDEESKAMRKQLFGWQISFVLNWQMIEVFNAENECEARFSAGSGQLWEGYRKRTDVLSVQAFLMLGAKRGRDYCTWMP